MKNPFKFNATLV